MEVDEGIETDENVEVDEDRGAGMEVDESNRFSSKINRLLLILKYTVIVI